MLIISSGSCGYGTKVQNAEDAGAAAVMVYNSAEGPAFVMHDYFVFDTGIPSGAVSLLSLFYAHDTSES